MPFIKGQSGNLKGRPTADKLINSPKLTGSEWREKEFKQVIKRLKPLNNKIVTEFEKMFFDERTTEASKLKIGLFLMKMYQDMMNDLYKPTTMKGITEDNFDDKDNKPETPDVQVHFKVQGSEQLKA